MKNIDKIVGGLLNDNKDQGSPEERRKDFYRESLGEKILEKVKGEWIPLDGATLVSLDSGQQNEYTGDDAYGPNAPVGRGREIGHFDSNGGSIVYVDGEGRKWMAPFSAEAQQALIDAGYSQYGTMSVPHMFDMQTRFKDENMHKRWLELSKKSGVEGKDFPINDEMKA